MFDVNQEFFNMIKTGDGYLWRGWKGKFTPSNRVDNAVKPSGSAFGQSKSPDGKEIYSWCKLDCCRQYFESCKEQVGSTKVETPVEAEDGLEWWEVEGDGGEDGVYFEDSEYGSDEESDDPDEESEEEDSDDDDDDDDDDEDEDEDEDEDSDEEEEEEEEQGGENLEGVENGAAVVAGDFLCTLPRFECCPVKLKASASRSNSTSSNSSFTMSDNSTPSTPPTMPCTPIMNSVDKRDLVEKYNLGQRFENALAAHASSQQSKASIHRMLSGFDFPQQDPERQSLHHEWSGGNRGLEALDLGCGSRAVEGDIPITFLLSSSE